MTKDALEIILNVIGEDNIKWMTFANYGDAVRGQSWISPEGIRNLKIYNQN